jgi:hypothetical protein
MSAKKSQTASRKLRARPKPGTLDREGLDEMAKRRCLMVLSVLSGERPVTEVIEEAKISRGHYYNLEERAIEAMLAALTPGSEAPDGTPAKKIAALEQKVAQLERQKRRGERLLLLTRKVVKPGPVTTTSGRPRSTRAGRSASMSSTKKKAPPPPASTPTTGGEDAR